MVRAKKYVVRRRFEGIPKRDDFEVVEYELPPIENDGILIKTEWLSVDPYQRAFHRRYDIPYDQFAFQVGVVEESKNIKYPVGTKVVSHKGWCDYCVAYPAEEEFPFYELPDLNGLSPSVGIGAVGIHGATAYFGFLEVCKPKAGETVVVTGAAGAVGSIVGQIAKIKGCRVIGFAGSDEKVQWLEKDIGLDKVFNYKTVAVDTALKEAAPDGVDCYFDNVGGEISSIIINNMNSFGRISVCGSISSYNEFTLETPKASILQPALVFKELKMEGYIVTKWLDRWPEAFDDLRKWIASGQIQVRECVTEGFDNIYDAFIGMLTGKNIGKAVVKL